MPGSASIYISDPTILGSKFLERFTEIEQYQGLDSGNAASGMLVELDSAQVKMNFMPSEQISDHLQGFAGYVHQMCNDDDNRIYLLSRLQQVRFVIGCVITPELDDDVVQFLFKFNNGLNGLLFFQNQVYDYDAVPLL